MAEYRDRSSSSGSALMVSAMAGAVLGAAGLAWWLLREANRRRQAPALAPHVAVDDPDDPLALDGGRAPTVQGRERQQDGPLHDRVHQLNLAIEDVRRQLESLQTPSES